MCVSVCMCMYVCVCVYVYVRQTLCTSSSSYTGRSDAAGLLNRLQACQCLRSPLVHINYRFHYCKNETATISANQMRGQVFGNIRLTMDLIQSYNFLRLLLFLITFSQRNVPLGGSIREPRERWWTYLCDYAFCTLYVLKLLHFQRSSVICTSITMSMVGLVTRAHLCKQLDVNFIIRKVGKYLLRILARHSPSTL